jgi:hypothetical protein
MPFKYLRVWVHWKKSNREIWMGLIHRIQNTLNSWKIKFLYGGRIVMLNAVIFVISLYYLSIYQIAKWVILKIDVLRRRFLWVGVDFRASRKYSLIEWGLFAYIKNMRV